MNENTETRKPGWYPDEDYPGRERFWTGFQWGSENRPIRFTPIIPTPATTYRRDLRVRRSAWQKRLAWFADLFS
jgi:hypothetical protein